MNKSFFPNNDSFLKNIVSGVKNKYFNSSIPSKTNIRYKKYENRIIDYPNPNKLILNFHQPYKKYENRHLKVSYKPYKRYEDKGLISIKPTIIYQPYKKYEDSI